MGNALVKQCFKAGTSEAIYPVVCKKTFIDLFFLLTPYFLLTSLKQNKFKRFW